MTGHHRMMPGPRGRRGLALAAAAAGLLTSACGGGAARPGSAALPAAAAVISPTASPSPVTTAAGAQRPAAGAAAAARKPLAGEIVGIDPGHNGRNGTDPGYIDQLIWNGRERETCDTTGTQTDQGYTEARFNFNVASYLGEYLQRDGAKVVLTRHSNRGIGPCVNRRSQLINRGHAMVAIDIHADGGPSWGRGFTVLEPVADGPNNAVIGSSRRLGRDVRSALLARTSMPVSDYYGYQGDILRDDLAGLNLTRVPKILIECGNMRNATDARLLTSPGFQRRIARALLAAIVAFLR